MWHVINKFDWLSEPLITFPTFLEAVKAIASYVEPYSLEQSFIEGFSEWRLFVVLQPGGSPEKFGLSLIEDRSLAEASLLEQMTYEELRDMPHGLEVIHQKTLLELREYYSHRPHDLPGRPRASTP